MRKDKSILETLEELDNLIGDNDSVVRTLNRKRKVVGVFPK